MKRRLGCSAVRGRGVLAALAAVAAVAVVSSCTSTVDGAGRVDPVGVSDYRAAEASSAARASAEATTGADYATCAAVTSSAAAASTAYNAFIARLNSTQSFDDLARTDVAATGRLTSVSSAVTASLTPPTSEPVRSAAVAFAARSTDLSRAVAGRQRDAFNGASTTWQRARDAAVAVCRPFAAAAVPAPSSPAPRASVAPGG